MERKRKVTYPIGEINDSTGYNKKKFIHTFTIFCENYLRTFKFTVDEDEKYENFDTLTKKGEAFISDDQERLVKYVFDISISGDEWRIEKNAYNSVDIEEIYERVTRFNEENSRINNSTTTAAIINSENDFSFIMFFYKIFIFLAISFVLYYSKNQLW